MPRLSIGATVTKGGPGYLVMYIILTIFCLLGIYFYCVRSAACRVQIFMGREPDSDSMHLVGEHASLHDSDTDECKMKVPWRAEPPEEFLMLYSLLSANERGGHQHGHRGADVSRKCAGKQKCI